MSGADGDWVNVRLVVDNGHGGGVGGTSNQASNLPSTFPTFLFLFLFFTFIHLLLTQYFYLGQRGILVLGLPELYSHSVVGHQYYVSRFSCSRVGGGRG